MSSFQFLVIIRGAPASGKTTIAKKLRNFKEKIVWLKVDNFKDFFAGEASLKEQEYVDNCALATLNYLLDSGFSITKKALFLKYCSNIAPPPTFMSKSLLKIPISSFTTKVFCSGYFGSYSSILSPIGRAV